MQATAQYQQTHYYRQQVLSATSVLGSHSQTSKQRRWTYPTPATSDIRLPSAAAVNKHTQNLHPTHSHNNTVSVYHVQFKRAACMVHHTTLLNLMTLLQYKHESWNTHI